MKGTLLDLDNGPATSKPPSFAECYVCQRQFGSHSLALHEPRCLQKWQVTNAALPPNKRAHTPVKQNANGHRLPQIASLTASWPSSNGRLLAAVSSPTPRTSRPGTTTLSRPKVLDADQAQNLDMTTTRVSDMLAVTSLSGKSGDDSSASSYSFCSDSSSSDSCSPISSSPTTSSSSDEVNQNLNGGQVRRPGTMRLGSGPRELNVPNIEQRARTAVIPSPEQRARAAFMPSDDEQRMPSPCVSCGKRNNPERFHSHPEDQPGARSPAPRARRLTKKRLSIQRPVPMRYHRQPPVDAPARPAAGQPYKEPSEQRRHRDPADRRRLQKRQEARERQARQKQEEGQRQAREQAMQRNLELSLKYERPAQGPTFIVCYLCGRQFGPTSLPIHQPQCLERWHKSNVASSRRRQGACSPHPPAELADGATLEQYNQLATAEAQRLIEEDERKVKKKLASVRSRTPRTPEPIKNYAEKSLYFIEF